MKKSIALLTALLMVLCLAGCGTSETAAPEKSPAESGAAEPETQASQTVPPSPSGEPETGKIIVTDMMGRQITLDAPAERVVALTAADCEILYAIGAGDLLVGRGEYCDYPEEVRDIPAVQSGNETNIEQIIALRPQVVFMSTMAQSLEHVTSLEAAGIKVVESRETSIDGVYYSIGVIGAVTGHDDEAAALIENMKASFAQLSENAPGDGTKTVYFEVSPLEWGLWTAGKNTYMNEIAEMLGYSLRYAPSMRNGLHRSDRGNAILANVALADVRLEAPIAVPPNFLAIGLNYSAHVDESGMQKPEMPVVFNKQVSCVNGPFDPIEVPTVAPTLVDYEGELGVVIGTRCRNVSAADAPGVVAGYVVVNDVSVRDWQMASQTMTMGKSWDTHGPIGPWLVTTDELTDPHQLRIRTWVDDELRQDASTAQMITNCWELIEFMSTAFTLLPGTIIATGTPSGVGFVMDPPRCLDPGMRVRIEIEGIGTIDNPVVAQPT